MTCLKSNDTETVFNNPPQKKQQKQKNKQTKDTPTHQSNEWNVHFI